MTEDEFVNGVKTMWSGNNAAKQSATAQSNNKTVTTKDGDILTIDANGNEINRVKGSVASTDIEQSFRDDVSGYISELQIADPNLSDEKIDQLVIKRYQPIYGEKLGHSRMQEIINGTAPQGQGDSADIGQMTGPPTAEEVAAYTPKVNLKNNPANTIGGTAGGRFDPGAGFSGKSNLDWSKLVNFLKSRNTTRSTPTPIQNMTEKVNLKSGFNYK